MDSYLAEGFDYNLNELKDETGIDLERDVIDELTGEVTVALLPSQLRFHGWVFGTIEALLMAEVGDPGSIERILEDFTDSLVDGADLRIRRREVGDYEVVTLDLSDQGGVVRDYSPGYLSTDNLVVLGTTEDSLFQVADVLDGRHRSLHSAPKFARLTDLAPKGASYIVFVDIVTLIDMVVDALPPGERRDYEKDWRPFVEPLDTFFAASAVSREGTVSTMVLTVEK